jgi:hypothetical protein
MNRHLLHKNLDSRVAWTVLHAPWCRDKSVKLARANAVPVASLPDDDPELAIMVLWRGEEHGYLRDRIRLTHIYEIRPLVHGRGIARLVTRGGADKEAHIGCVRHERKIRRKISPVSFPSLDLPPNLNHVADAKAAVAGGGRANARPLGASRLRECESS